MRYLFSLLLLSSVAPNVGASDLSFEPNRGQTQSEVRYLARTPHGVMFFTDRELVLRREGVLRFELLGANAAAQWEGIGEPNGETSYFVGRDESKWVRGVPGYARLARRGIYPGIDAVYYGSSGKLEYDFVVAPHADPSPIRFAVKGARKIAIDDTGALVMETTDGVVRQHKPELYQILTDGGRHKIYGTFRRVEDAQIGFDVGAYDPSLPLVIDPVIESSVYLGGSGEDSVVASNSITSVGMTSSIDFPGAEYRRRRGRDIFVQGISSSYGGAITTAIYGGNGDDVVTGADLSDSYRGLLIYGYTDSTDLPTNLSMYSVTGQSPAWQPDYGGGASDGMVLTITSDQRNPIYLSYIGGPGDDRVTGSTQMWGWTPILVGTTTQRGLSVAAPIYELGPGGGTDGFLLAMTAYANPEIRWLTYFGGSGDDRPFGIAYANNADLLVTGETASADFPLTNPFQAQRAGETDAFLMRVSSFSTGPVVRASTLIGGSGSDRGVKVVVMPTGEILMGGVTSSPDLAMLNPLQAAYGGGASDIFLARFTSDLSRLKSSTYFGGSGADELTSLSTDTLGSLFAGGYTSSTDLPVKNAVQPTYGGGADDGLFLHLDSDGTVHHASYLGGSGSDRILGITAEIEVSVIVSGQTTSPDFPVVATDQSTLAGSANGFLTRISTNLLGLGRVISGKNLRASFPLSIGRGASAAEILVTSSDPSKVLVAQRPTDPGQESLVQGTPPFGQSRTLYVDCLVDSGGADLSLSAAGFPSKVVRADCYPARALLTFSNANNLATNDYSTSVGSGPITFGFSLAAFNPADEGDYKTSLAARPGSDPVTIQISNSNAKAGTLSTSSVTVALANDVSSRFEFQPLAIGDSTISYSAQGISPPPASTVHVTSSIQVNPTAAIASGLTCYFRAYRSAYSVAPGATITATSLNPEIALLTSDPTQPGAASVTMRADQLNGMYAQGVGKSGEAVVSISLAGAEPVTTRLHVEKARVGIANASKRSGLTTGEAGSLTLSVTSTDGNGCWLNLDSPPLQLVLENSNSSVVEAPSIVELPPGTYYKSFPIRAVGDGTATITLRPPDGMDVRPNFASVTFTSRTKALRLDGIELGKDLLTYMDIVFPSVLTAAVPLTITSSDPSLVLLSDRTGVAGLARITSSAPVSTAVYRFYVHGLAASGEATVSVDAGSLGKVTATVRLVPSGWTWSTFSYTATLYSGSSPEFYFRPYALDPSALMPVAAQGIRFGVTAPALEFDNSNPEVVATKPGYSQSSVVLTFKSTGASTLTLRTPSGFTAPARGQQFNVKVLPPSLSLNGGTIGKDLQVSLALNVPGNLGSPVTVTSSDPSKLLLSTDPAAAGSGSVVWIPNQARSVVAQAVDSHGTVTITATALGYKDASAVFGLTGSSIAIQADTSYGGSILSDGKVLTTTQSPVTQLRATLAAIDPMTGKITYSYGGVLRGGIPDLPVEVQSSATNVGLIDKNPGHISANDSQTLLEFKPVGVGDTEVTVVQPPGFMTADDQSKISFRVTQPSFTAPRVVLGKDTFGEVGIQLPDNVTPPSTNVAVTLTSGDPSRLLLSRDAETAPAASLTRTLIAGQRMPGTFWLHALGNSGTVPVRISASGYADTIMVVALTDTAFGFQDYYNTEIRAVLQLGPQELRVSLAPATIPTGYSTIYVRLRPGLADLPVAIQSSDPAVVTFTTPAVIFKAGSATASVSYQPLRTGAAVVSLIPPAGFTLKTPNKLSITVEAAKLSTYGAQSLGRDLQATMQVSAEGDFRETATLTITSSDPSKLLLADSPTAVGQREINVTAQPGRPPLAYLNALAASGSVTVSISGPGYAPVATTVTLAPSAAIFASQSVSVPRGLSTKLYVGLAALDPATQRPYNFYGSAKPRPGANLSVSISSSDTAVAALDVSTITFTNDAAQVVDLRSVGVGTALISLGLLPDGVAPASNGQVVVNVVEPDISLPDFTLGYQLQVPVRLKLSENSNPVTYDQTFTVASSDQYQVAVSGNAATPGGTQVTITIPAGQRQSQPFYVQGRGQNGKAQLQFYYQGNTYRCTVSLDRAAFIVKETTGSPVTLTAGAAASTYTIVPAVTAQGALLIGPASIAPQASSKTIGIGSTNAAVATVSPSSVTFAPGDSEKTFTVRAVAAGTSSITLSGDSAYYLSTPASKLDVVVK